MLFSLAFLVYSGSVAILYNIYSLLWRWLEKIPSEVLIHIITVLIALKAAKPTSISFNLTL